MDREGTATKEFVLGKAIAQARRKAGMTQQDLCQKANLSYSTLAKIERGAIRTPSIFTVAAIAEATRTPLTAFVGNMSHIAPDTPQKDYKTAKNGIKFVYFDVNGVMVRFFQRAFTDLADDYDVPPDLIEKLLWHYNDALCSGKMPLEEFNRLLAENLGADRISWAEYYLKNIDPVADIHDTLKWVAEYYPVGLLTNNMPTLTRTMLDKGVIPDLGFSAVVDSSEVKLVKPQAEIYQKAAEMAKTEPQSILLVDDSSPNLIAAEKLGWHVLWFDNYKPEESAQRIKQTLEF